MPTASRPTRTRRRKLLPATHPRRPLMGTAGLALPEERLHLMVEHPRLPTEEEQTLTNTAATAGSSGGPMYSPRYRPLRATHAWR